MQEEEFITEAILALQDYFDLSGGSIRKSSPNDIDVELPSGDCYRFTVTKMLDSRRQRMSAATATSEENQ